LIHNCAAALQLPRSAPRQQVNLISYEPKYSAKRRHITLLAGKSGE
jgi:hypothetical protein